uniref:Uncharacterized protein n=1 Tax=Anguilla anguilla TaxID=7936 RepID=A0A0E9S6L9_ANGAN
MLTFVSVVVGTKATITANGDTNLWLTSLNQSDDRQTDSML